MNDYASLRKKNNGTFMAVMALALCVVVTAAMLFSRLLGYSTEAARQLIPLTRSGGTTVVTAAQKQLLQPAQPTVNLLSARSDAPVYTLDETKPGFQVSDENTVWTGETSVEIFRLSYENGEGQVTVNSARGDKVLAPGTENEYIFTLQNTGNVGLDYTLTMEAYFSDGGKIIPVVARLVDYEGNYLLGSAEAYADVLALNNVLVENSISAGYVAPYTLQWQWPFEGDDAYDTWLGDLAENADITLTIVIHTVAEHGGEGGLPDTGDTSPVALLCCVMVGSFAGMLVLLLLPKRKAEEANEPK